MIRQQWVLSPGDSQTHLLAEDPPQGVLKARCGHLIPAGPLGPSRHDEPRNQLTVCPTCALISIQAGEPLFPLEFPAGRRLSASAPSVPGDQPDPTPVERVAAVLAKAGTHLPPPRWVQSLLTDRQHVLTAHGVAQAAADGRVHAVCGYRMDTDQIGPPSDGPLCMGCVEIIKDTLPPPPPPPPPLTRERIVTRLRTLLPDPSPGTAS